MATQMKFELSRKEWVLVGLTAALAPMTLLEVYGVSKMRAELPEFAADPNMPHGRDLLVGVAMAFVLIALRRVLSKAFQPIGRFILTPDKSVHKDRLDRFGTVLFKFAYVSWLLCFT